MGGVDGLFSSPSLESLLYGFFVLALFQEKNTHKHNDDNKKKKKKKSPNSQ